MNLTPLLRDQYRQLFETCRIRAERLSAVDGIVKRILAAKDRYLFLERRLGCPWYFPAVLHSLEAGLRFDRHLHNGDPLTARTTHVPAGRPPVGSPPFSWEESALDALRLKKVHQWTDWSMPALLYKTEEYNGWGYRKYHPETLSPYLWSFTNHYTRGKYVADGRWDPNAVSQQCGAAALLRRMANQGLLTTEPPPPPPRRVLAVLD